MLPALLLVLAATAEPVKMTAAQWQPADALSKLEFIPYEGFPQGILGLKSGGAILKGVNFTDGTIELDLKPIGEDMPGIRFHQHGQDTADEFYLRPTPNCPAAQDCMQYTVITHGHWLWDIFPQYQKPGPVNSAGWNHLKLVISGRRMNVYINHEAAPSLAIGRLEGDALDGELQLESPAYFANLTVTPNAVEGLSPRPQPDPTGSDPRYLRSWFLTPPMPVPANKPLTAAQIPPDSAPWQPLQAERFGLLNIDREFASPAKSPTPTVAWLKTTIDSDRDQTKHVSIGWVREVWVFVNGSLVFADKNLYYPSNARKVPDGRLSLENGGFNLPLRRGSNQIAVAISNNFLTNFNHYGWGFILRADDLTGIHLASGSHPQGTPPDTSRSAPEPKHTLTSSQK